VKKYFVVLSVALVLGLLAGMLAFSTVSADPIIGKIIQVPVIQLGDGWETWIHIFNKSQAYDGTGVIVFFWGEYSGLCPSNSPPPSGHICMNVPWNGVWTVKSAIPAGSKSAIIFAIDEAQFVDACLAADGVSHIDAWWEVWSDLYPGEELAVVVDRKGPNDFDTVVSSAYTGISEEMEGEDSPYKYFAPYTMKGYNDLDTIIYIQNSGKICGSVWIQYEEQGFCSFIYSQHIEQIAPGETYSTTVPAELSAPWLGSAYIESNVPLGIVVDQTSLAPSADRGMLLSWRGQPYQPIENDGVWDTEVYGDLIFREWSGWNASVQVQNLTKISQPTFVTVDFMDNSGDEILFLADWICPGGSETFYLPVVTDLGFDYWGAVEIESHEQVDWPGGTHDGAPIFAIIDLKNATRGQGGAYNAHPRFEKENAWDLSLPLLAKKHQNLTSLFVIRNNSNCNKIKPEIKFKNQEGRVVCMLNSFWLHPKHSKLIDLANIGCLTDGWVGAAEIQVTEVEQICSPEDSLIMPSAVVVNRVPPGVTPLGDETRVYEAFPIENYCIPQCFGEVSGTVFASDEDAALADAEVTVTVELWCGDEWSGSTTTDDDGEFSFDVPVNGDVVGRGTLKVLKTGYLPPTAPAPVPLPLLVLDDAECGDDVDARPDPIPMRTGASISGVTFYDINDSGTYDDIDEARSGATVEIFDANGAVIDPVTEKALKVTSDDTGVYKFVGLQPNTPFTLTAKLDSLTGTVMTTTLDYGVVRPDVDIALD